MNETNIVEVYRCITLDVYFALEDNALHGQK